MDSLILPDDLEGGMIKLCSWGAFSPDMEPYVELLPTDGRGTRTRFTKKAFQRLRSKHAADMAQKFAEEVQPKPNSTYMLTTALGAYDHWGANKNGDAFREDEDLLVNKEGDDRGYRSFRKHANVFQHHQNKDPNRAMGKIVVASFNPVMHRVELIEELDNFKAAAHIRKWHEEGSLPTSMGCKVAFDVCSVCGNRAKSAAVYCEHAKYAMKRTLMDGQKVCVFNPNPCFFDHSHVSVPADRIAGVMEKVASVSFAGVDLPWAEMEKEGVLLSAVHGEFVFRSEESDDSATPTVAVKTASMGSSTELSNRLVEEAFGSDELSDLAHEVIKVATDREPELPLEILEKLAEYPLETATASMMQLGILPNPREWQFLALCHSGQSKVAHDLHDARVCFQPRWADGEEAGTGDLEFLASWNVNPELVEKLGEYIPSRSFRPEFLSRRLTEARELVKTARPVEQPWDVRETSPGLVQTMVALAASYGILRMISGEDLNLRNGLRSLTGMHPAVAGALLAAGVTAGLVTADRMMTPSEREIGHLGTYTKLSCLLDAEDEGEIEKLADSKAPMGAKDWLKKTPEGVKKVVLPLGAFSAGFLGSSYIRAKQLRGQQTGSIESAIAEHPLLTGIGAVAAYGLARKGLKRLRAP